MPIAKWKYTQESNGGFQKWTGYPDTRVEYTSDWPYQAVFQGSNKYLLLSKTPFFINESGQISNAGDPGKRYYMVGTDTIWWYEVGFEGDTGASSTGSVTAREANHAIFTTAELSDVWFSKTTTAEQDGGITTQLVRAGREQIVHKADVALPVIKQRWPDLPVSPYCTFMLPYQCIVQGGISGTLLIMSSSPITSFSGGGYYVLNPADTSGNNVAFAADYVSTYDRWLFPPDAIEPFTNLFASASPIVILEANHNIYDGETLVFAKTVDQDNGAHDPKPIFRFYTGETEYQDMPSLFTDAEYSRQIAVHIWDTGETYLLVSNTDSYAFYFSMGSATPTFIEVLSGVPYFLWVDGAWVSQGNTGEGFYLDGLWLFGANYWGEYNSAKNVYTPGYNMAEYVPSNGGAVSSLSMPIAKWRCSKGTNGGYQKWTGFPDSPIASGAYPYQCVLYSRFATYLFYSTDPLWNAGGGIATNAANNRYRLMSGVWVYAGIAGGAFSEIFETNTDIYTDSFLTTVEFPKTTTTDQDGGIVKNLVRLG